MTESMIGVAPNEREGRGGLWFHLLKTNVRVANLSLEVPTTNTMAHCLLWKAETPKSAK